jgi:hypothetical protein
MMVISKSKVTWSSTRIPSSGSVTSTYLKSKQRYFEGLRSTKVLTSLFIYFYLLSKTSGKRFLPCLGEEIHFGLGKWILVKVVHPFESDSGMIRIEALQLRLPTVAAALKGRRGERVTVVEHLARPPADGPLELATGVLRLNSQKKIKLLLI